MTESDKDEKEVEHLDDLIIRVPMTINIEDDLAPSTKLVYEELKEEHGDIIDQLIKNSIVQNTSQIIDPLITNMYNNPERIEQAKEEFEEEINL